MSDLSVNSILDASGGATTTINGFTPTVSNMAGRNRIINGDMRIDQRNNGAAVVAVAGGGYHTVDRFNLFDNLGSMDIQQSTIAPAGFSYSTKYTVNVAGTLAATSIVSPNQSIEGLSVADLNWGTVNAKQITVSFWCRSSITGVYGFWIRNSAADRSYTSNFTINSVDTWQLISISVAGDTTGTWLTTNAAGLTVGVSLALGADRLGAANAWQAGSFYGTSSQVAWHGTVGATFYITGVQLEAGSVATPFEHRQYGQELALCQRYYYQQTYDATNQPISSSAYWSTSTNIEWLFLYPVPMRATPSISFTTIGGLFALESQTAWRQLSSVSVNEIGSSSVKFSGTAATNTNYATRQPSAVGLRATGSINYSAEL